VEKNCHGFAIKKQYPIYLILLFLSTVRHRQSAIVVLEVCIEMVCEAQAISDIVTLMLAYRRCVRHKP
jgi:hypothetical protein